MSKKPERSASLMSSLARMEHELMLLCARTRIDNDSAERIKALAALNVDWNYLYLLAQRNAVLPLLHRQLNAFAGDRLPQEFQKRLSKKFRENATRNTLLAGELTRLSTLCDAEGISTLAYKGPALALMAYRDLSLRRFIDLDVIVKKRNVARVGEILRTQGFKLAGDLSHSQEEILLRSQHNLAFSRDGGKLIIEIHWEVSSQQFASVAINERIWDRASIVAISGGEVKSLSPDDLLLALCVHGTKHMWERLAWICDVAELIQSCSDLDWNYVLKQAQDSHVERMLHLGLRLASDLLSTKIPLRVHERILADEKIESLSSIVAANLFDGVQYKPASLMKSLAFNLRARRRVKEKLQYLHFVFKPTDGDLTAVHLPSGLTFVYYLLRPIRLLTKGASCH